MKIFRTIGVFIFAFGGVTLVMKFFNKRPGILAFLGDALDPVAIILTALGAIFILVSYIKFKKKGESAAPKDPEKKSDE